MVTDRELITQAVHDRLGGWYDAVVTRMDQALHPGLIKRSPAEDGRAILAKHGVLQGCAEGEGIRAGDGWVNIDVADVCGSLATAVARSASYREYLHL